MGQGDGGANDGGVVCVGLHVLYEIRREFQFIQGQVFEGRQRRIATAKIVHREFETQGAQSIQHGPGMHRCLHQSLLTQLQAKCFCGSAVAHQERIEFLWQLDVTQVAGHQRH